MPSTSKVKQLEELVRTSEAATTANNEATNDCQNPPDTGCKPVSTEKTQDLQEELWNTAYDNLKVISADIVDAYESILSARLQELDDAHENIPSTNVKEHGGAMASASLVGGNQIEKSRAGRRQQMDRLIQAGLQRTQKDADTKGRIYTRMQAINNIKGIMEKAVQTSPAAAVAWVGVSFILEVRKLFSFTNAMSSTQIPMIYTGWIYYSAGTSVLDANSIRSDHGIYPYISIITVFIYYDQNTCSPISMILIYLLLKTFKLTL